MTEGKGSLTKLEQLKAEYGPKFKAAAPKRRKIDQECGDLLCPYALRHVRPDRRGLLWIKNEWCAEKRCPKERGHEKAME